MSSITIINSYLIVAQMTKECFYIIICYVLIMPYFYVLFSL